MKAILISDRPKWCALMMNGKKTIEVRKGTALYKATQKLVDEYGYADIYVYCTKNDGCIGLELGTWKAYYLKNGKNDFNGKVIFKFRCYKVSDFSKGELIYYKNDGWCGTEVEHINTNGMCLTEEELHNYLKGKTGCAIHISDLEIFDKPKELSEFRKLGKKCKYQGRDTYCDYCSHCDCIGDELTKAPQSFCYIEVGE